LRSAIIYLRTAVTGEGRKKLSEKKRVRSPTKYGGTKPKFLKREKKTRERPWSHLNRGLHRRERGAAQRGRHGRRLLGSSRGNAYTVSRPDSKGAEDWWANNWCGTTLRKRRDRGGRVGRQKLHGLCLSQTDQTTQNKNKELTRHGRFLPRRRGSGGPKGCQKNCERRSVGLGLRRSENLKKSGKLEKSREKPVTG